MELTQSLPANPIATGLPLSPDTINTLNTTLLQNVSHQLQPPIDILQGYAELLHEGGLGDLAPEQHEALTVIVNRAAQLKKIVSRIGALLEIQAHSSTPQPLILSALVAQLVEQQRAQAAQEGIQLHAHLAPDLPFMLGDADQLQTAMECLVENALKFTPNGGNVTLTVTAEPGWVCFGVSDTGIGMTAQEVAQLRQPFQDAVATPQQFGGLGLLVVQQVLAAHNGTLRVTSKPGAGSQFTLAFPAISAPTVDAPISETDAPPCRILIVDDEEFVVFTLQEGLEKLPNCHVTVAMSGQDALALFAEQPFDLLITDYRMPDMNGVELAVQIRARYPQTSIIMITAYSNHLIQEPSAMATIQRVLNKPVRLADIRAAALETLSKARSLQPAR